MDFIRRNINKTQRNGNIYINASSSYYGGGTIVGGGGGSSSNEGNYLPATKNSDGTYTVDLTQVNFNGNIIAQGEVSAYGTSSGGTIIGSGGTSSGGTMLLIDIEDNLTSTRSDAALSANQGRLLKQMIDEKEVDLSNYYTKTEVDNELSFLDGNLSNYYTKTEVDAKDKIKLNKSIWDKIFEINSDGSLKVKVNLYGDGEISSFGSGATENDINLDNYYTKDEIDYKLDNIDVGNVDVDLSNYYTKSQTDTKLSAYTTALNNHTTSTTHITEAERTNWNAAYNNNHTHTNKSVLDGISSTNVTNWNTAYNNNHTHSNKSVLDGISSTNVSNWNSAYNNIHSHSTLTFSAGKFSAKTYNPSGAATVNIPTHTSHLSNDSGFITTAATVANANYASSAGSATNATTASKLSTVSKTAWGQTFWTSGGIPTSISGNMTGVGSISASGNITTTAEVTAHSDIRLKTNIKPLTVRGTLNPVQYIKDGKESIGFIAQEVQELYPELVIVDESTDEKYLSLNYQQLTAVLYAEIQELKKEITELKNKHKWL